MSGISRRAFVATTGVAAAGIALVVAVGPWRTRRSTDATAGGSDGLGAFIRIGTDGVVTIVAHRAEMGQGAYSVVPQIVAEELEVPYEAVRVELADGDPARYGNQTTGGSSTVRNGMEALLVAGATARDMLVRAAAQRWSVAPSECTAVAGVVRHAASGRDAAYGALVADASLLQPASDVPLKPRHAYRLIGQSPPRKDIPLKVTGAAVFGLDVRRPGMRYAVVARNPRWQGRLASFDGAAALRVPGVTHVVPVTREVFGHLRDGVAVVATSTWAAMQGRNALQVAWDDAATPPVHTDALYDTLRQRVRADGLIYQGRGAASVALDGTPDVVDAVYETPYQAHACMEPLNCVADVTADRAEIWAPVQAPDWVRAQLATSLGLPHERVTVHMTFLGGGFGRKAFTDWTHEAAMVSKAIGGPVQVVWTREDDLTQGPFRPGMVYRCRGVLARGRVLALEGTMAGQNMSTQEPGADVHAFNRDVLEGLAPGWFDAVDHWRFGNAPVEVPVPVMWWRSVYASTNAFAYESFVDELAKQAGADPFAFRRAHLTDARSQALLDRIASLSGWDGRARGQGFGLALTHCFGSTCAHVVKVRRAETGVAVERVWAVLDCGLAVHPDNVKAQVEGSIVMALGAALQHAVTFADGRAVQQNFDTYRLPQLRDVPPMVVDIMPSDAAPGGAGEPGLPGVAPALANAIADLTGQRLRRMPFALETL
jgi:isoquinoline 1-oxidoreductase subunit beta